MPILAPPLAPPPPPPLEPPWSLTVAELGPLLTAAQRKAILARLRVKGYAVNAWPTP